MEQHDCPACEAMRLAIVRYKAKTINELRRHLRRGPGPEPEKGGLPIDSMTKVRLITALVEQDFPNDDVNDAMHDFIAGNTT